MRAISLMAAFVGIVVITGCSGGIQAVSEPTPQIVNERGSLDAANDKLRKACLTGSFFGRGLFEQGACHQYR